MKSSRTRGASERDAAAQEGSALIWALLFMIVTAALIISHTTFMAANRREMDIHYRANRLARSFAQSGLTDALTWFQRQMVQPVTAFQPRHEPAATPPVLDTLEPTLGLVREFEVRGNLWGRYEVRKTETYDVTSQRNRTTPGSVWDLGARGYLFRKIDPDVSYDEAPNRIEAVTTVRAEMRGLPLRPPGPAAIAIEKRGDVTVGPSATVGGNGSAAFAYRDPGGPIDAPATLVGVVTGTPTAIDLVNFDASPKAVFGTSMREVELISDIAAGSAAEVPDHVGDGRVVFVAGPMRLGPSRTISGRNTLLVVDGDLDVDPGASSELTGIVYVAGDVTVRGSFQLDGTMVVGGKLDVGGGADTTRIKYDQVAITAAKRAAARYRLSRQNRPGRVDRERGSIAPRLGPNTMVDPTASLGDNVVIGADGLIGPDATLGDDIAFGDELQIDEGATVGSNVTGGDRVKIKDRVKIGAGVRLGDDAKVWSDSSIGAGSRLGALVTVKSMADIGRNVEIGAGAEIDSEVVIGDGATVLAGVRVPKGTVIPPGAVFSG